MPQLKHRNPRFPLPLLIPIVVALLAAPQCRAQTGFRFLELGVGSTPSAMGEAYTSLATDATAVYWNPAGLARINGVALHLTHTEWFEGVRQEYAGAATRMGRHAIGGAISGIFTGSMDRRDDKGRQIGTYGYYDMAAAFSYAYEAGRDIWVGGTLKYLREGIDHYSGDGVAADVGVQWALPWSGVTAGAALRHLGPGITVNKEETKLPTAFQGGLSVRRAVGGAGSAVLLSVEGRKSREDDANLLYGLDYITPYGASLQAGYRSGTDSADVSFGARLSRGIYTFSYAFVPYSDLVDVGDTHRVSLDVAF
jgi:hypothetical protein